MLSAFRASVARAILSWRSSLMDDDLAEVLEDMAKQLRNKTFS